LHETGERIAKPNKFYAQLMQLTNIKMLITILTNKMTQTDF